MKLIFTIPWLLVAVSIAQAQTTPTGLQARKVLEDYVKSETARIERDDAHGKIKLVSFKKTDGQLRNALGMKSYRMEYEAEIEFLEDGWCPTKVSTRGLLNGFTLFTVLHPDPDQQGRYDAFNSEVYNDRNKVQKGQRRKFTGTIYLEKTEKGWRKQKGPQIEVNWQEN